jgi:hypothetical protein
MQDLKIQFSVATREENDESYLRSWIGPVLFLIESELMNYNLISFKQNEFSDLMNYN